VPNAVGERFRVPLRWWRTRGVFTRDGVFATAFTILGFTPALAAQGVLLGQLPVHRAGSVAFLLNLGQCLPLALRRRSPAVALAVVACAFAAYQLLGYPPSFTSVGLLLALYAAGAWEATFRRELVVGATASYVVLAVALDGLGSRRRPVDYVVFYLCLAACWAAGAVVRSRRARAGERRRRAARQHDRLAGRQAGAQERARIARELHEDVARRVSGIVVQADSAHYLLPGQPGLVDTGLTEIGTAGRRALSELRYLLGVLDVPVGDDPGTAAERLRDLVEQARLAGQPVDLIEKGEAGPLSAAIEFIVYRTVQEALDNAVKHAPGQLTLVQVGYGDGVSVEVTTDGPAVAPGSFVPGRGLSSLRDRVRASGGRLEAGRRADGGFRVRARIPAGSGSAGRGSAGGRR